MARTESLDREQLLKCGYGELFGPGNAQLPVPNMLMMDRIVRISDEGGAYGKGEIVAELDIHPDLWFFGCHFPGDPVMPGCLGLDAMWQMVGFFLAWIGNPGRGRALGVGEVKFTGQVLPTAKLVSYHLNLKRAALARSAGPAQEEDDKLPELVEAEAARHHRVALEVAVKEPEIGADVELCSKFALAVGAAIRR